MKNRSLEFWRFIFSIIIALYHFRAQINEHFLQSGYLAVEFFFILSGFFLAANSFHKIAANKPVSPELLTIQYMKKKIKRLYPHYLYSWFVFMCISIFILHNVRFQALFRIRGGIPELFMLQMAGISNNKFAGNAADWYVSSLFIASYFVYYLAVKLKSTFTYFVAPCLSGIIYTFLYRQVGNLGTIRKTVPFTYTGTYRAIAGLCLGVICYAIFSYVNEQYNTKKFYYTIAEFFCIVCIAFMLFIPKTSANSFLFLPVAVLFIICISARKGYISRILDNEVSSKLGKLSYAIFLNHTIIRNMFVHIHYSTNLKIVMYIGIIIVYSMFTTFLLEKFEAIFCSKGN